MPVQYPIIPNRATLDRRLDALLTVIKADRNNKLLEQLKARAGIIEQVDKSVLLPLLYWHLVERPM